jgi:hypothetical protein
MNEEEVMQYVGECGQKMETNQGLLEERYDLHQYPAYWGNEDTLVLRTKSDSAVEQAFSVVFIGKHASNDEFTWSWADESLSPAARERSAKIKELSAKTGFDQFETPTVEMDPPNLEQVVAVVLDHLGAAGLYVDKSKEPLLLVAIAEPRE